MKVQFIKKTRYLSFGFSIVQGRVYDAEMEGTGRVRIKLMDPVFTVVNLKEVKIL